jgi:hypothetical protein
LAAAFCSALDAPVAWAASTLAAASARAAVAAVTAAEKSAQSGKPVKL